ncbi:D-2-hydroxyacid dehydrogenase [Peribacillus sp. SCS-37]|uniref:D-2-hydroxyacid dehydrogenase n=1 Tax=Paraperibacillus esterisolvens TaxID=3115296 RepID=UPI003905EA66
MEAKRKLVIGQNLNSIHLEKIKEIIPGWDILTGRDSSAWVDEVADAEVIAGWRKEMGPLLEKGMRLKWVQSWSAGVNSFPLSLFEKNGVILTSAAGVHAYPISETIFALMLGLTRNIHAYVRNQQVKTWHHSNLRLELHGKTAGILGIGAIGRETAKIAKAFGMKVLGLRYSGKPDEHVDVMYTPEQLHTLLPQCDYLIITLPLTKETEGMIGAEELRLMKPSAFLINIGRGQIIDEPELIRALTHGGIAGAGLDVFENEPLTASSPLWDMENVIVTPHTAGATEYYDERLIDEIFIPNLREYVKGSEPPINAVSYQKGY